MRLYVMTLFLWEHSGGCVVAAHDEDEAVELVKADPTDGPWPVGVPFLPFRETKVKVGKRTYPSWEGQYSIDRIIEAPFYPQAEVIGYFTGTDH